jgi:hypothetical protein
VTLVTLVIVDIGDGGSLVTGDSGYGSDSGDSGGR